jgi:hypothetical protein
MIQRCHNKKSKAYKYYGARGIIVCDKWRKDFKAFYDWAMGNGYVDNLTIDRINVDRNYEPSNCRWATAKEQANNKRNNLRITFNGKTQTAADWEREYDFKHGVISKRLRTGMTIAEAMQNKLLPNGKQRLITYNGETKNIYDWAKIIGIKYATLVGRLTTAGWSIERALSTPSKTMEVV